MSVLLDDVVREVAAGLPSQQEALIDAQANQDYYNGENLKHIEKREGEDDLSFRTRRKRVLLLTQEIVNALCLHLYNPGPDRVCQVSPEADTWLQSIWKALEINSYWQEADRLSTLNDWCLFQVASNDDLAMPITLQLWGREESVVWVDPDDPKKPQVICTIDRYNGQCRYRVYDETTVVTLETQKWDQVRPTSQRTQFSGGTRAARETSREEHGYGELPFVAVHYLRPVRSFHTVGPGSPLRRLNAEVDAMLCDLAEGVQYTARPTALGFNLPENFRMVIRAGGITHVQRNSELIPMGETGPEPRLEPFIMNVDVEGLWADIDHMIDHALETLGVPKAAVRMNEQTTASGVALVQEQMPLIKRAESRQPRFAIYEGELAGLMLRIGGIMGNDDALYTAGLDPQVSLTWPEITIDSPGPERDQSDRAELELGLTSRVELLMRRKRVDRPTAVQMLAVYSQDEKDFAAEYPNSPSTVYSQEQFAQEAVSGDVQKEGADPVQGEGQGKGKANAQGNANA